MADAGRIGIYAGLVTQSGAARADSAVSEGGRILLKASKSATLDAGSVTTANGVTGGSVTVQSGDTTLVSGTVEATGADGAGGNVQILGGSEVSYLRTLPPGRRRAVLRRLARCEVTCFVVTKGLVPPPELLAETERRGVPVLVTPLESTPFIKQLSAFLDERLALRMQLHSVLLDVFGLGVLVIEHDMHLVMNVCERITVLDHGETIAVGSPTEIQCHPKVIEAYLGD